MDQALDGRTERDKDRGDAGQRLPEQRAHGAGQCAHDVGQRLDGGLELLSARRRLEGSCDLHQRADQTAARRLDRSHDVAESGEHVRCYGAQVLQQTDRRIDSFLQRPGLERLRQPPADIRSHRRRPGRQPVERRRACRSKLTQRGNDLPRDRPQVGQALVRARHRLTESAVRGQRAGSGTGAERHLVQRASSLGEVLPHHRQDSGRQALEFTGEPCEQPILHTLLQFLECGLQLAYLEGERARVRRQLLQRGVKLFSPGLRRVERGAHGVLHADHA